MNEVAPLMDELRIFYGLYQSGPHTGRTTVILWPYKNGQPAMRAEAAGKLMNDDNGGRYIEPFNEGAGNP